jgi:predicted dehydrogenase
VNGSNENLGHFFENMNQIGIVGLGHLGEIHLKQWLELVSAEQIRVFDNNSERLQWIAKQYSVSIAQSYDELLQFASIIDVVTPTQFHFQFAKQAIAASKHVFIEKPICYSLEEAKILSQMIEGTDLKVQVGHVERFNPAFTSIEKELVDPQFFEIHRLAPFNPRGTEVSVVMDLMIHDIDIVLKLVQSKVKSIQANGVSVINSSVDIANARVLFENGCVANFTASRISMKKMRKMRIFKQNMYATIDFLDKVSEVYKIVDADLDTENYFELQTGEKKKISFFNNSQIEKNAIQEELKYFLYSVENQIDVKVSIDDASAALALAIEIQNECINKKVQLA